MQRSGFMIRVGLWIVAAAVTAAAGTGVTLAQEADVEGLIDRGEESYTRYCSSCHGAEASGDGPIAPYLKVAPPDLTRITAMSQGEFPFDDIYDIVDGRAVEGHGTRAMPVWGPAFIGEDPEADKRVVKEKIVELVYYLKSLQPAIPVPSPKMGGEPQ